jgi:uncharacterized protein (DUF2062 family)
MKPCVVIPVFNHAASLAEVVRGARAHCPVIVVDDGSTDNPPALDGVELVRFEQNRGKGAALRDGFAKALGLGFTHAISMDADGQHFAEDVPKFLAAAERQPEALLVGVRNFVAAGAPARRRRANRISSFWFCVATGVRLGDTQCGFRCYPLATALKLRVRAERYAFELESLARAAWANVPLVAVPVGVRYDPELVRGSHFRPIVDLVRITNLQIGLVLQAWLVPAELRAAWSVGEHRRAREVAASFFSENAHEPGRLAGAVGLGLFCGMAPIWGFHMVVAATLAHLLRLNKATTLLASNISMPPLAPFIVYGGLVVGNWLFAGQPLTLGPHDITMAKVAEYFGAWFVGSVVLGAVVAVAGMTITYCIARLVRRR